MKRRNINVYKLTHQYLNVKPEIFIKSEFEEMELVHLINGWQVKAVNIEETFDLDNWEMFQILLTYDKIREYPNPDDVKKIKSKGEDGFDYITLDLYNIWEASDINVSDSDLEKDIYKNEKAEELLNRYINEELEAREKNNS